MLPNQWWTDLFFNVPIIVCVRWEASVLQTDTPKRERCVVSIHPSIYLSIIHISIHPSLCHWWAIKREFKGVNKQEPLPCEMINRELKQPVAMGKTTTTTTGTVRLPQTHGIIPACSQRNWTQKTAAREHQQGRNWQVAAAAAAAASKQGSSFKKNGCLLSERSHPLTLSEGQNGWELWAKTQMMWDSPVLKRRRGALLGKK